MCMLRNCSKLAGLHSIVKLFLPFCKVIGWPHNAIVKVGQTFEMNHLRDLLSFTSVSGQQVGLVS
jgi:hypothetical protein